MSTSSMEPSSSLLVALGVVVCLTSPASADTSEGLSDMTVRELLAPCVEGDNDSRDGAVLELECEQYIQGFTDAYVMLTDGGKVDGVCLPRQNRSDEVRWAHKNLDDRDIPAAQGIHRTLKSFFSCP